MTENQVGFLESALLMECHLNGALKTFDKLWDDGTEESEKPKLREVAESHLLVLYNFFKGKHARDYAWSVSRSMGGSKEGAVLQCILGNIEEFVVPK